MANAGYGIFIETTPKRVSRAAKVKVFSGEQHFKTKSKIIEDKGTFYCPVIASLITAGGRLLLAILEREVRKAAGMYLFCDTDSMAILAARKSRKVRLTAPENDTQQVVAALSWNSVKKIVNKLKNLNPYGFPGSILKVEKDSLKRAVRCSESAVACSKSHLSDDTDASAQYRRQARPSVGDITLGISYAA